MGNAVTRREDPALLTGQSPYVADMSRDNTAHLAFVRSVMAHAGIRGINADAARQAPGVVDVITAAELGVGAQQMFILLPPELNRPLLTERARYVGDPIAVVIAHSAAAATDAAELVEVDYEPFDTVTDPFEAMTEGAPVVLEAHGSNRVMEFATPVDDDALSGHDLVVQGRFAYQRMAGAPIEPSAVLAEPTPEGMTVWCTSQAPHTARDAIATALGEDPQRLRVVAPAVGGGFGPKAYVYPEFMVAACLSRRFDRPVKWVETRSENLMNMMQGRDQIHEVELGITRNGDFCWMRIDLVSNIGAYPSVGAFLPFFTMMMASGPYRIPTIGYTAAAVTTNTTPVSALRGAGRPEATATLERVIDIAAAEIGMDPVEMRLRNLLKPEDFPLTTPTGANMDCGDYPSALRLALQMADYDSLRAEQRRRIDSENPVLMGIGVSVYVEVTAGGLTSEFGAVEVQDDGSVVARVGTASHGQGHVTAFTQILCDVLGVAPEQVRIVHSDTSQVPRGLGTIASRSLQIGGAAVWTAANEVLDTGRRLAARLLEADADDIVVSDGGLSVAGVPAKTLGWAELAAASRAAASDQTADDTSSGKDGGGDRLAAETDFDQGDATYPFGAHVSVVELDSSTGDARVIRHIAVDDCGRILNPLLVRGQVHGGTATGIAQALYEQCLFDADGNPRNTNFADYAMPAASELPRYEMAHTETPTPRNPLGAKGIGESGTIGATPAVQSAVLDALAPLGVTHLDMPLTPQKVWNAIRDASDTSD